MRSSLRALLSSAALTCLLLTNACGTSASSGMDVPTSSMDATMDNPTVGTFCSRAPCSPDRRCCEPLQACLPMGQICPDGTMIDVPTPPPPPPPPMDVPGAPTMCGAAVCGPSQQCCQSPIGPTCAPLNIPCMRVESDGGPVVIADGSIACGANLCAPSQECCSIAGVQYCAAAGMCFGGGRGDGGGSCGGQTCSGAQVCCNTRFGGMNRMFCISADLCARAGGNFDAGM